jgi:hypothetical protein
MTGRVDTSDPNNPLLKMVAELSLVQNADAYQFAVVTKDYFGLAGRWNKISGSVFGYADGSSAEFADAEVWTRLMASACPGGTDCQDGPVLQGNVVFSSDWSLTVENNNLLYATAPQIGVYPTGWPGNSGSAKNFLNSHTAVANYILSTSTSQPPGCLAPNHVFVKDNANDRGAIPSTLGGQAFWESPDIFLVPHGSPVDPNGTSAETLVTPGHLFDIWVRVNNDFGCSDVGGVQALVNLAEPSLGLSVLEPITNGEYWSDSTQMTEGSITVPAGGRSLLGPYTWRAPDTYTGSGHKCLLAAIKAAGESPPPDTSDAPGSNQVAQRNIELSDCAYPITNATTSDAQVQLTLQVTPPTVVLSLTDAANNVSAMIEDPDSTWYNAWTNQQNADGGAGGAGSFAVSHIGDTTVVRLGTHRIVLDQVRVAPGQSRAVTAVPKATNSTFDCVFRSS